MTLSEFRLREQLKRPFQYFDSITSTNDWAMQWLRDDAESSSVVIADEQTQGKGRKGRTWYTPPGVTVAVSVILKPQPEQLHRISMIGALAVYDLCETVGIQNIGIKWPNDVQIKGKKVCGILPEAAWDNDQLLGVVLGMGVNVRVPFEGELAKTATNIETALGQAVDRVELVVKLLQQMDFWMAHIDSDKLFETWQTRLNTLGQQVRIDDIIGQAQAVDSSGALLIKMADGSIKRVLAGDVSLLSPQDEG